MNKKMRKRIKTVLYVLAVLLQFSVIFSVFILKNLTRKRAGVMRHVYHRKAQYAQGIFAENNLRLYTITAVVMTILLIALLIYALKRGKSSFCRVQILLWVIINLVLIFVINANIFKNMLVYPYFIFSFAATLLIQIVIISVNCINFFREK
jgi:hypothetical protein